MLNMESIDTIKAELAKLAKRNVTLEPGWTGHDGPSHLRITAPLASSKKNSNCKSPNIERNDTIRRLRAEGTSLDTLMQMYGLTKHSLHQIIGERE